MLTAHCDSKISWYDQTQKRSLLRTQVTDYAINTLAPASSVRRILKRWGQKLQKIWEKHRSEFEIVSLKFRPIFRPKLGEEQKKGLHLNFVPSSAPRQVKSKKKGLHWNFVPSSAQRQVKSKRKRSSLKFRPIFRPKSGEEQKKKVFAEISSHFPTQVRWRAKKSLNWNFIPFFAQNQVSGPLASPLNTPLAPAIPDIGFRAVN